MQTNKKKVDFSNPSFNKNVRSFFIRLAILASLWFVSYHIILKPPRIIDRPLTNFLTATVATSINIIAPSNNPVTWAEHDGYNGAKLVLNNKKVFGVWDVCNGIDLMFIYVSIIILLPYPAKRKLVFCLGGIVAIILANIIRIVALYFIYVHYRSAFDFSHHYLFTLLMYVLIFYGWLLFIKKGIKHE